MTSNLTAAAAIDSQIAAAYKELVIRERAASHLRSMAKTLNQSSIEKLYDRLNHLHIQKLEAA